MTAGDRTGENFRLDPGQENRLGRGLDCQIILNDPQCSRVHAIIRCDQGNWLIADNGSLNGTQVNDQKIDEARLAEGSFLRLGNSEFAFHDAKTAPENLKAPGAKPRVAQTIVKDAKMLAETGFFALGALDDSPAVQSMLLLHQLSIRLLGCADPEEVIRVALELGKEATRASLIGFLSVHDEGELKPKVVMADHTQDSIPLSQSLTERVSNDKHAVWVSNHQEGDISASLQHYSDAICVPMLVQGNLIGAVHVYLDRGRFRQEDFDFTISLASITAVALARAHRERSLQTDYDRLKEKSAGTDELIGESPPMQAMKAKISRLGRTTGCVLIRGESGAGKELVARALHRVSSRADRPMLSVNCAAIPADLMESQLFGHKAGAFTSADRDHVGYFQQADGGTLFLDEAGELTLEGQAKLLRILEGHPFLPVGGTEELQVDVRVIAATNRDLQTYVRERKFREDLYYRLSVFELELPPLRDRGEDIAVLIDHFLEHFKLEHGRTDLALSKDARAKLLGYHWPGNVRQLRNVMDSAVVLADGEEIGVNDLGLRDPGTGEAGGELDTLNISDWERKLIKEALKRTGGNVPESAKLLGIGRATLYRKIDDYGLKK